MKAIDSKKAKKIVAGDAIAMTYGTGPVLVVDVQSVEPIEGGRIELTTDGGRKWVVNGDDRILVIV